MASLRLPCFPSPFEQSRLLNRRSLFSPPKPQQEHLLFFKGRNLSLSRPSRGHLVFQLSSAAHVEAILSQSDGIPEEEQEEEYLKTRLLASNVPWTCTHEDIRSLFEKYGRVIDVELSMHKKTRNRGLAFVTMGSPEEALNALNNLESYELEGRTLKLNYAKPRKKKAPPPQQPKQVLTFNLFVANLSFEARSKHLKEFFDSESTGVVSAEVIFIGTPRKSAGYGFVSFKSKKAAEGTLLALQGKMFMGRPIQLARCKQFVKVKAEGASESEDASALLKSIVEQTDMTT